MDGKMMVELVSRFPLAEAVWWLFDEITSEEFLGPVYEKYRGRSYQRAISFATIVHLVGDALLQHGASGRKSFQRAREEGELSASIQAAYGKLARIPLSLSMGWLLETSRRLLELYPAEVPDQRVPESLREMEVVMYDGKTIKYVAHRLKALRDVDAAVPGGRLVLALHLSTGPALAMGADEDGECGEQGLVPSVLPQVREVLAGRVRLHVADRGYCDLVQMERFSAGGTIFCSAGPGVRSSHGIPGARC